MAMERQVMAALTFCSVLALASARKADVFDVTTYGANPNMDIREAFSNAWREACALPRPSKVLIPRGVFNLTRVSLQGPCKSQVRVELRGTLVAPSDPSGFEEEMVGLLSGESIGLLWPEEELSTAEARRFGESSVISPSIAENFPLFDFVTNSLIRDIVSLNSKRYHINVLGGHNITLSRVSVIAPENSPNTDGIHIGRSTGITVVDTTIQTGDDCVSIGDGSKGIAITRVTCGPGHGISVGSLGKYPNEEPVEGVTVTNCTIKNTANGVRIKTWPNSHDGFASNMRFSGIEMDNVWNPVIIDQEYCPWNKCNKEVPSRIKISDVTFKNIWGTSATALAVNLICSDGNPCRNVEIANIDLHYSGEDGSVISQCKNVETKINGKQNPPPCVIS